MPGMKRVAILGLGLMGGSLALALRKRARVQVQVFARRAETRAAARERNLADVIEDRPDAAVEGADLVVACVPVERIPALIGACLPGLAPDAVVTDVGSTKAWVQAEAGRILSGSPAHFVGSHPIAGSERQGLDAARADLYENAVTVVTEQDSFGEAADRVEGLWKSVGSRVLRMAAEDHDRILARTSHLPHLAAAVLAATAGRGTDAAKWRDFCGTGFQDSTRVAEGGPEIWIEIIRTNREAILRELAAYSGGIEELARAIRREADDDVRVLLDAGRNARRRLLFPDESGPGGRL